MHLILPDASPRDLIVDRIHRIAKPSHLTASVPRDVLMRVHFFHIKEKLLRAARNSPSLPGPYDGVLLFPNLSKYTLQLRRQLNPITKGLHNHKIQLKWRYPATLLITRNGASHVIHTFHKGMQLLHTWGIIPDPPQDSSLPLDQRGSHPSRRT